MSPSREHTICLSDKKPGSRANIEAGEKDEDKMSRFYEREDQCKMWSSSCKLTKIIRKKTRARKI